MFVVRNKLLLLYFILFYFIPQGDGEEIFDCNNDCKPNTFCKHKQIDYLDKFCFPQRYEANTHKRRHSNYCDGNIFCWVCGNVFTSNEALEVHHLTHAYINSNNNSNNINTNSNNSNNNSKNKSNNKSNNNKHNDKNDNIKENKSNNNSNSKNDNNNNNNVNNKCKTDTNTENKDKNNENPTDPYQAADSDILSSGSRSSEKDPSPSSTLKPKKYVSFGKSNSFSVRREMDDSGCNYKCPGCVEIFPTEFHLVNHIKKIHRKAEKLKSLRK